MIFPRLIGFLLPFGVHGHDLFIIHTLYEVIIYYEKLFLLER